MGLSCMNCKEDTKDGKFFAEAFVCPACYLVAERLYTQGEKELRHVLMTLKELIRVSILEGRLSFAPAAAPGEAPPRRAIDVIADMMQRDKCHDETLPPNTVSGVPTQGAGGQENSAFMQGSTCASETPSTPVMKGGSEHA
jgi:hypothetical protein